MTRYMYTRVSSQGQNLDRQTRMANELGIDQENVFQEKKSGKNLKRAELQRLLDTLQEGDVLYIESFSRLSRSLQDLLSLCDQLKEKGVELVSLKEGEIDTRTATGRMMLGLMGVLNQYEREILAERRLEGQRIKRERDGKSGGRSKVDENKLTTAFDLYQTTDRNVTEICKTVGISRAVFYKYAKERNITRD